MFIYILIGPFNLNQIGGKEKMSKSNNHLFAMPNENDYIFRKNPPHNMKEGAPSSMGRSFAKWGSLKKFPKKQKGGVVYAEKR